MLWTVSSVTVTYDVFRNVSPTATVTAMDTIRPFIAAVVGVVVAAAAAAAAAASGAVGVLSVAVVADTVLLVVFVVVGAIEKCSHSSI